MKIPVPKIASLLLLHSLAFYIGTTSVSAYDNSGYKWSGTSASYYINSTFASSFRTAMQAADATWDASGSRFRLSYVGTTSRNPDVSSAYYSDDGYNDIGYANKGRTGSIAVSWGDSSGTTITERDTTFNTYYGLTTVGAAGSYDVQSMMTHEFGHWLKLDHVTSVLSPSYCYTTALATMCQYPYTVGDTYFRSLTTDDKNGIKAIYGI